MTHFDAAMHDQKEKDHRHGHNKHDDDVAVLTPRSVRFKEMQQSSMASLSSSGTDDSERALNKRAAALAEEILVVDRSATESLIRRISRDEKERKEKRKPLQPKPKTIRSKSPKYDADGNVSPESPNGDGQDFDVRRMSHDQQMEMKAKQLEVEFDRDSMH